MREDHEQKFKHKKAPAEAGANYRKSAELLGLTGLDLAGHTRVLEPHGNGRGVVDERTLHREVQGAVGLHVLVDLYVGGIPDVIMTAHLLAEGLDAIPVVIGIELVGMTPDVEEPGGIPGVGIAADKGLGQVKEAVIVVVAGGL